MADAEVKSPVASASVTRSSRSFPGESGVIWTLWWTYGVFYFCRNNASTAVTGIKSPISEGGLGLGSEDVGWILASAKIAYGLGQLLNGQLSERISPRIMLAIGMFGSAILNVLFGFGTGFYFLLFVWATNGFCQSLGWTPCMRVVANWVNVSRRGHAIGIIGTGYQVTQGLTYVVAGLSAEYLGWRGAFFVPALIMALSGVFTLVFLRETPPADDEPNEGPSYERPTRPQQLSVSDSLYWTLYNPTLWLLGLSLGLLNACRYGFLDWGISHLMETQQVRVGKAGLTFFVIAIGATAGSYLAGWATDRFFGSRRAPVACMLMAILGVLSLCYDYVVRQSVPGTMAILVIVGFCIYGPQVLLVGTAPADLAHRGTSAAAAGFVNFMGYMGAATGDVITGYYSAPTHGGWQVAIYIWAGWAFAGSVIMAILWNTTTRNIGVLPGVVPKLAAISTMIVAAAAITYGYPVNILHLVTYASVLCLLGTFVNRWCAVPSLIVAAAGVLIVFGWFVQSKSEVTWDQSTAMVAYGLTMIIAIMILVERKGMEACE